MENNYQPTPIDTGGVVLPEELTELTEEMACNVHEVWAAGGCGKDGHMAPSAMTG